MKEPSDWAMKRALSLGILCGAVEEGNATYSGGCGGGEPAYATACFSHRRIARALDAAREEGMNRVATCKLNHWDDGRRDGIEEAAKMFDELVYLAHESPSVPTETTIAWAAAASKIRALLSPEPKGETGCHWCDVGGCEWHEAMTTDAMRERARKIADSYFGCSDDSPEDNARQARKAICAAYAAGVEDTLGIANAMAEQWGLDD